MALVSAVAAEHGRRPAFITSLGIASGIILHATASALGLSLVLAALPEAFTLLKTATGRNYGRSVIGKYCTRNARCEKRCSS